MAAIGLWVRTTTRRHVGATVFLTVAAGLSAAIVASSAQAARRGSGAVDEDTLRFTVADDGAGFDMHDGRLLGHGFVNMADRLGAIDGRFDVQSKVGAGTCISGAIPLNRSGRPQT